jgi:hypothetical protein
MFWGLFFWCVWLLMSVWMTSVVANVGNVPWPYLSVYAPYVCVGLKFVSSLPEVKFHVLWIPLAILTPFVVLFLRRLTLLDVYGPNTMEFQSVGVPMEELQKVEAIRRQKRLVA